MKSNVIIKSLDDTNRQYDWLEIDFNSYLYDEGNSGTESHSNHYNLSVYQFIRGRQKRKLGT